MATLDEVIGAYLALREQKEAMVRRHKEELAPLTKQLETCQNWVHQHLLSQGTQNTRTQTGSAFLQTDTSVTVENWEDLIEWVKANNAWSFLERRASKTVVQEFAESTQSLPPGVKMTQSLSCHIRK